MVCERLVAAGVAQWLDKARTRCLVTRKPVRGWADDLLRLVQTRLTSNIVTIDELHSGEDVQGTGAGWLPPSVSAACWRG